MMTRFSKTLARVAPISDSLIGGMLASKYAITQANRTYILKDSLFAICCLCKLNLIWQLGGGISTSIFIKKCIWPMAVI